MGQVTRPQSVIYTLVVFVPTFTVCGIEHFVFQTFLDPFLVFRIYTFLDIDTLNVSFNHVSYCISGVRDLTFDHVDD